MGRSIPLGARGFVYKKASKRSGCGSLCSCVHETLYWNCLFMLFRGLQRIPGQSHPCPTHILQHNLLKPLGRATNRRKEPPIAHDQRSRNSNFTATPQKTNSVDSWHFSPGLCRVREMQARVRFVRCPIFFSHLMGIPPRRLRVFSPPHFLAPSPVAYFLRPEMSIFPSSTFRCRDFHASDQNESETPRNEA